MTYLNTSGQSSSEVLVNLLGGAQAVQVPILAQISNLSNFSYLSSPNTHLFTLPNSYQTALQLQSLYYLYHRGLRQNSADILFDQVKTF